MPDSHNFIFSHGAIHICPIVNTMTRQLGEWSVDRQTDPWSFPSLFVWPNIIAHFMPISETGHPVQQTVIYGIFCSVYGRFAPLTFRPFTGRFAPWTFRPLDVSPPGRFAPRTFRHLDVSPATVVVLPSVDCSCLPPLVSCNFRNVHVVLRNWCHK